MTELFDLTGNVALVTGASGRLGPAVVRALCGAGAHVVAVARAEDRLQSALADVPRDRVTAVAGDITSPNWPQFVSSIANDHGSLDIVVNNAHVGRGGSLRTATDGDFDEAFELAVKAPTRTIQAATPALKDSATAGRSAAIINVSSMYGLVAPVIDLYDQEESRNPPAYGAAKAALVQLTRYAAAELGEFGVRANTLVLGPFPGDQADSDLIERLRARTMLDRVGDPREIETAILFLASPRSGFVTGSTVTVDGGWTAL